LGLGAAGDDTLDPGLLEVVGRGLLTILAAKFCRGSGLGAVTGAGTGTGTGAGAALICWFISPLAALTRPAAPKWKYKLLREIRVVILHVNSHMSNS